jgi:hypothetical protein
LTTDVDFMSHVIEQGPGVFQDLSDRSRDDDGIARLALKQNHRNFELCSDRLRDDDNFARFAVEEYPYDDKIFGHCSERLQADPLMQAYMAIVEAEVNREKPDLTAFPQPIQDAWNIQTPFLSTGNNDKEARELFVGLARGAMEAEARRSQSPSDQVQDAAPLGSGVSAGDLDLDINPYASHTERTLKPANDVDGPEHDLHRGPR